MAPIIPSDVPYVIAFVAVAILFFWLMGRLGQRGLPGGRWRALAPGLLSLYFVYVAVSDLARQAWLGMAFAALMGVIGIYATWSAWRQARAAPPRA